MRLRLTSIFSTATLASLLCCSLIATGCARMQERREWGGCAAAGALLGAGVGAASGIVIADYTRGRHRRGNDGKVFSGLGGAAIGAGLGALIGHYACDPLLPPPPPPPVAQAAPPPPPSPPPPPPPAKEKLVLRGVHFAFNKALLRPEDEAVLDEAAETLKSHADVTVNVDGYCDGVGSDEYNQKLSQRRAEAVAKYLEGKGIPSARLVPRGFGKSNFVATNDTEEGRAQNRRVELTPAS